MRLIKPRYPLKGFTLIEVATALAVFSFAIVGLISLIPMTILNHRQAISNTILSQITQQMCGEVEMCGPAEFQSFKTNQFWYFDYQGNQLSSSTNSGIVYRAETQMTNVTLPGQTSTSSCLQLVQIYSAFDPTGTALSTLVTNGAPTRIVVVNQPASLVTTGL